MMIVGVSGFIVGVGRLIVRVCLFLFFFFFIFTFDDVVDDSLWVVVNVGKYRFEVV